MDTSEMEKQIKENLARCQAVCDEMVRRGLLLPEEEEEDDSEATEAGTESISSI